jgi:hypothetical protein
MLLRLQHTLYLQPLPEDKPSRSKHVEEIVKVKILVWRRCVCWLTLCRYIATQRANRTLKLTFFSFGEFWDSFSPVSLRISTLRDVTTSLELLDPSWQTYRYVSSKRRKQRHVPKHRNPSFTCTAMPKEEKGGSIVPFCAPYRLINLSTDLHETWYECYVLSVVT